MAEGAGGRESYPTSDIPNKYIYDAFLMIYLAIFLLLFHFLLLQLLIRDSQRLQFCNFYDFKRKLKIIEVIEKEPLILEKSKEHQSKYYLSHPKLF